MIFIDPMPEQYISIDLLDTDRSANAHKHITLAQKISFTSFFPNSMTIIPGLFQVGKFISQSKNWVKGDGEKWLLLNFED